MRDVYADANSGMPDGDDDANGNAVKRADQPGINRRASTFCLPD
jgi:hypothetical protein